MNTQNKNYFDIKRDNELIAAGTHFWCEGCLMARPLDEQSSDPRYCRGCCDFLIQEANLTSSRADWVPKVKRERGSKKSTIGKVQDAPQVDRTPPVKGDIIPNHTSTPPAKRQRIMSTLETPKGEVDVIAPRGRALKKRGPKHKVLPVRVIMRWAEKEEMGSKAIATRLGKERGIKVSYKTVQRILLGQRPLGIQ